jgi:alpha-mannosidase
MQLTSRRSPVLLVEAFLVLWSFGSLADAPPARSFTRLEPLPAPKIIASTPAYPGGHHKVGNLLDGKPRTEYSSNSKGTNTFVEFDFGAPTAIAAFRHVDRNDPATVAASELSFLDAAGAVVKTVEVQHVNKRGGETFLTLPAAITAQRVRWRVTGLGGEFQTVGGAEIGFFKAGGTEPLPKAISIANCRAPQMMERAGSGWTQPLRVSVHYPYAEPVAGTIRVAGTEGKPMQFSFGEQTVDLAAPAVAADKTVKVEVVAGGLTVASQEVTLKPVRKLVIYLLPHSHNDIGYTALQADVEKKQNSNIETGLRLGRETANYPEGARFKWNVEVLWCVDNYLRAATPEKRAEFIAAVKSGQVGLDALYCNILTGLCRPEELLNLMGYATRLGQECGVPVESAMISDVPGYTWSTVSAMAQGGVKYFSFAPNYFDRMGGTMKEWQNRPFWWVGPDGKQRVLCWCPSRGYALGHLIGDGEALARFIPDYLTELETNGYPYDITHLRWNVHGDNGSPDEKVAGVVRDWNARYAWPKLVIATTAEAFRDFERHYGKKLPEFRGDYTPYWEDGAASSALETALNRASAERLTQAETIWAMRQRQAARFPAEAFQEAWRNVLLYSEHTWGAHNSISQPDLPFVRDQWKVKQAFALDADKQSRQLLTQALESGEDNQAGAKGVTKASGLKVLAVFNTSSWERTDLVTVSAEQSGTGERVVDEEGKAVPAQRLSSGELVFLARKVPAFAARRFRIEPGACTLTGSVKASGTKLESPDFVVQIDEQTGAIKSLFSKSLKQELVDAKAATQLNDYFYLPGSDLSGVQRNSKPKVSVKEHGPLVASLLVECEAPGCKRLLREVRLIDGLDRVELINTIDKLPVRAKEGLHFGYGFNVPKGTVRLDVGWAMVQPEVDQIPAACKNWFSVQRWLDISNDKFGVTWSPVDAPLVEIGGLTANLVGSQTDWRVWRQHIEPSQTIYSWAMNNHWHTNYRADQEGPTVFRFAIRPHTRFAAQEAAKFGVACSQPLVVCPAFGELGTTPRVQVSSPGVLVAGLKPSDDGRGWLVRLFGASGRTEKVRLSWAKPEPRQLWLSDTSEQPKQKLGDKVEVPAWGIVTVRADN